MKTKKTKKKLPSEISDYDETETADFINVKKALSFSDLGLKLPQVPPSQVVSIRLPTSLLNEIRAFGSQQDVPYHAIIKLFLMESLLRAKKRFLAKAH